MRDSHDGTGSGPTGQAERPSLRAGVLVVLLCGAFLPLASAAGPDAEAARKPLRKLAPITAEDPLIVHTLYTWYTHDSFKDASVQPLEPFSSDDAEYYRAYFSKLRPNGVDVIAGVLTGLPGERRPDGSPLPTAYQAENLMKVLPLVGSAGMKFFIYYDTAIRSYWKNRLSTDDLDMRDPRLRRQFLDDFAWIADEVIKKHQDDYLFLQTQDGRQVVDDTGAPRPVIAIYLVRALRDAPGFAAVKRVLDDELAGLFHRKGLGRPALVLDVVFWGGTAFDSDLVSAFGENAVALTSFCPVYPREDVHRLGDWVPLFEGLYAQAAREMAALARWGVLSPGLQLWPGVMPNFETRSDKSARAVDLQDWEAMLRMGLRATVRQQAAPEENPLRAMTIIYTDEYYEGTPFLTRDGLYTLPLTVQGNVLKEFGIRLEKF
jgi:hypothetical protein